MLGAALGILFFLLGLLALCLVGLFGGPVGWSGASCFLDKVAAGLAFVAVQLFWAVCLGLWGPWASLLLVWLVGVSGCFLRALGKFSSAVPFLGPFWQGQCLANQK